MANQLKKEILKEKSKVFMDLTKFDKQKQLFTPQQRIEGTKQSDMKGAESSHSSEYQKSEKNNKMDHS